MIKRNLNKSIFLLLALFILTAFESVAQVKVSGKVTDDAGSPLVGANVFVKGTTIGTVTNPDGEYSLSVPDLNAVLVFSFIGYLKEEVSMNENGKVDVMLLPDITSLSEIVVIGYGTQKKIDLSGSVAVVNAEDLEALPIKSAAEALKGRAAGVYVKSNSGQPGENPSILVRGRSSISAGNDPLLVVDGIPGVSWSSVDFNDVVSITVLKDAASASIYGSSGANGVILITTRRGQSDKDRISFSYKSGISLPPKKLDVLTSEQAIDLIKELGDPGGMLSDRYTSNYSIDTNNLVHTDWQDEIFRTGRSNIYNLSFSGGSEDLTYYISGGFLKDEGFVTPSNYDRVNFRSNLDYKFSDKLKMSTDINFSRNSRRAITTGDYAWNGSTMLVALNTYPFLPVYSGSGSFFVNPFKPNIDIPTANINGYYGRSYNNNLSIRYTLNYEIFKGFSYQLDAMNQTGFSKGNNYRSRYHTYVGRGNNGSASSSAGQSMRWDINNILRYNNEFGKHNIEAMAGFVTNTYQGHSTSAGRSGYPSDSIQTVYVETNSFPGIAVTYSAGEGNSRYEKRSYIGRINYNYNSTYLVQLNIRSDGSSRFGSDRRWGTFPSASARWNISNEGFFSNVKSISNLSLRYSIGITGNDAFGDYLYASFYNSGSNHGMWNDETIAIGYTPLGGSAPNPKLQWEETTEQNLALEFGLWNNRLVFTGELFDKNASNLIYNSKMPPHTGFSSGWVNIGKVNTKGYDIQLTSHTISTKDFRWSTTITFSGDRNEVMNMGGLGDQFNGDNIVRKGEPIDAMYGWVMNGIYQTQEEIDALSTTLPDGTVVPYQEANTAPGDIRFANLDGYEKDADGNLLLDINGNPYARITAADRKIIGKPNPDFHYGIDNRITYKNFEFSFFFQGVYGANILSLTRREIERLNDYFNYSATVLDRWQYAGQNTNVPRATSTDPNGNIRTSTRWMEDASFLRLKYLTLSYSIPEKVLSRWKMTGLVVSLTGENLLTFTDYSLYDPEIATSSGRGIDMGGYPQARSFSVNLKLDL